MASEADLQRAVMKYLRQREWIAGDLFAIHVPNEGKRTKKAGGFAVGQGLRAGAPDVLIFLPKGRVLHVELKTAKGSQTASQKDYEAAVTALGHDYHLIKAGDVREAVAAVEGLLP